MEVSESLDTCVILKEPSTCSASTHAWISKTKTKKTIAVVCSLYCCSVLFCFFLLSHFCRCFDLFSTSHPSVSFMSFTQGPVKVGRALSSNRWGSSMGKDTTKLTGKGSLGWCFRTSSPPSKRWSPPWKLYTSTTSMSGTLWETVLILSMTKRKTGVKCLVVD